MTTANGNIFRVSGPLWGEFTGHLWIPLTKATDAELWCFSLICAWINRWVTNGDAGDFRRHRAHYDATVMIEEMIQIYYNFDKVRWSGDKTWWRHQMETFCALLAICAGTSPVPVNSPLKGQWRGTLMFPLICSWINDWVNNHEAGDLRRHRGHYDVNVMRVPSVHVKSEFIWYKINRNRVQGAGLLIGKLQLMMIIMMMMTVMIIMMIIIITIMMMIMIMIMIIIMMMIMMMMMLITIIMMMIRIMIMAMT